MPLPSFLSKDETFHIPVGGDFGPSSFIGNFMAATLYMFYSTADLPQEYKSADTKYDLIRRKMGAGWRYYARTEAAAKEGIEISGEKSYTESVWSFQASINTLLNVLPESREKFSDPLFIDVPVATMQSKKEGKGAAFGLLAMPSAVAAMAKIMGYETPGYDLSELGGSGVIYQDEFQWKMIGAGDAKVGEPNHFTKSVLWERRAKLWKALGEDDPAKVDTEASKLKECLSIVTNVWTGPVWLRMTNIPNPHMQATYENKSSGETKRNLVGCITEIYPNQQSAQVAAQVELDERAKRQDEKAGGSNGSAPSGPALPSAWAGMQAEFIEELAKYKGKPVAVAAKALEVTADEVKAWREIAA